MGSDGVSVAVVVVAVVLAVGAVVVGVEVVQQLNAFVAAVPI